jgi:hypothetical protein
LHKTETSGGDGIMESTTIGHDEEEEEEFLDSKFAKVHLAKINKFIHYFELLCIPQSKVS